MASRLIHGPTGSVLAERLEVARSHLERMRGLLGRDGLPPGEGLLIERCASIHTFFMRFPIDVLFVSGDFIVRKCVRDLRPWRLASAPGARHTVELPPGTLRGIPVSVGDALQIEETA